MLAAAASLAALGHARASGWSELSVFGTRHATDDGIDVFALSLDFVDVEAPQEMRSSRIPSR